MLFSLSNPWLRQTKRIDAVVQEFFLCGTGYNSSRPEKSYKIVGFTSYFNEFRTYYLKFAMFEFATNAWKIIDHASYVAKSTREQSLRYNNVSLNGNLYQLDSLQSRNLSVFHPNPRFFERDNEALLYSTV